MSGDGGSEPLSSGIGILACRMLHAEVDKHIHVLLYAAAYDALGRSLFEDVLHEMHTNLSQFCSNHLCGVGSMIALMHEQPLYSSDETVGSTCGTVVSGKACVVD